MIIPGHFVVHQAPFQSKGRYTFAHPYVYVHCLHQLLRAQIQFACTQGQLVVLTPARAAQPNIVQPYAVHRKRVAAHHQFHRLGHVVVAPQARSLSHPQSRHQLFHSLAVVFPLYVEVEIVVAQCRQVRSLLRAVGIIVGGQIPVTEILHQQRHVRQLVISVQCQVHPVAPQRQLPLPVHIVGVQQYAVHPHHSFTHLQACVPQNHRALYLVRVQPLHIGAHPCAQLNCTVACGQFQIGQLGVVQPQLCRQRTVLQVGACGQIQFYQTVVQLQVGQHYPFFHLGAKHRTVYLFSLEPCVIQPPVHRQLHIFQPQPAPLHRHVESRARHPVVGHQLAQHQSARCHLAPVGIVVHRRVEPHIRVPFQVAHRRVQAELHQAVACSAVQRGLQVNRTQVAHQVGCLHLDGLRMFHRRQVVVGGVQAVYVHIHPCFFYHRQSCHMRVHKQAALLAEIHHHLFSLHVGYCSVHMTPRPQQAVHPPQHRRPVRGLADIHLRPLLQHHIMLHRVAVVGHLLPTVIHQVCIHKYAAVSRLQV